MRGYFFSFLGAALLLAATLFHANGAAAQDVTVTPTQYQFTMQKMELCENVGCSAFILMGSSAQVFNIGSSAAGPGAQVGSYVQSVSLEIGKTYTHLRVTLGRTFILTGGSTIDVLSNGNGGACHTDGTGSGAAGTGTVFARSTDSDASARGNAASSMNMMVPDVNSPGNFGNLTATFAAAGITIIDASTMSVVLTLTAPFTVTAAAPSMVISFDVANTLNFTGAGADTCVIWFEPPAVAITIS